MQILLSIVLFLFICLPVQAMDNPPTTDIDPRAREDVLRFQTFNKKLNSAATWQKQKEVIREAIEWEDIHPDRLHFQDRGLWAIPALNRAINNSDEEFVQYLLNRGAVPNKVALFSAKTVPLAHLLIKHGANIHASINGGPNVLHALICDEPHCINRETSQLALYYFRKGIDLKATHRDRWGGAGRGLLVDLALHLEQQCHALAEPVQMSSRNGCADCNAELDNCIDLVKILIGIGAPLDTVISAGPLMGCDYKAILQKLVNDIDDPLRQNWMQQEVTAFQAAIDHAQTEVIDAKAERVRTLNLELECFLNKNTSSLVVQYADEYIIPKSTVQQLNDLDRRLKDLDSESNFAGRCVIS